MFNFIPLFQAIQLQKKKKKQWEEQPRDPDSVVMDLWPIRRKWTFALESLMYSGKSWKSAVWRWQWPEETADTWKKGGSSSSWEETF